MADYAAFENREQGALHRVEGICRHLTAGGAFTDTTPVTGATVLQYLDDAYYFVVGKLMKSGYATAVTAQAALGILEQIQALDAAVQTEHSMPVTASGEPNDRFKGLAARRDTLVRDFIESGALEDLGATRHTQQSGNLELTGRSIERKRSVYDNSDVVPSRFPRGVGQRQDVGAPRGRDSYSGAEPGL